MVTTAAPAAAVEPDRRLTLAITGASGAAYGVRLLQMLRHARIATDLVVSPAGWITVEHELSRPRREIEALADRVHGYREIGASIASGSFPSMGMIVAPCSMKTLAAVATGFSDSLVSRAADVCLKERRRLVLMPRETPLNLAHLRNMTTVTEMGGIVFPPVPAFYHRPGSVEELVDATCARVLGLFNIHADGATPWPGLRSRTDNTSEGNSS